MQDVLVCRMLSRRAAAACTATTSTCSFEFENIVARMTSTTDDKHLLLALLAQRRGIRRPRLCPCGRFLCRLQLSRQLGRRPPPLLRLQLLQSETMSKYHVCFSIGMRCRQLRGGPSLVFSFAAPAVRT